MVEVKMNKCETCKFWDIPEEEDEDDNWKDFSTCKLLNRGFYP
jgi:hypothetical protein